MVVDLGAGYSILPRLVALGIGVECCGILASRWLSSSGGGSMSGDLVGTPASWATRRRARLSSSAKVARRGSTFWRCSCLALHILATRGSGVSFPETSSYGSYCSLETVSIDGGREESYNGCEIGSSCGVASRSHYSTSIGHCHSIGESGLHGAGASVDIDLRCLHGLTLGCDCCGLSTLCSAFWALRSMGVDCVLAFESDINAQVRSMVFERSPPQVWFNDVLKRDNSPPPGPCRRRVYR